MVGGDLFSDLKLDLKSDSTWDTLTPSASVGAGGESRPEMATPKARKRTRSGEETPDDDPPLTGEEVQHKIDRLA